MELVMDYGTNYRTENLPRESEIVTIIEEEGDFAVNGRKIILATKGTGEMEIVDSSHPAYFPLQYPLIWPYGNPGWTYEITARHPETGAINKVSRMKYLRYQLYFRFNQPDHLFRAKFLF
jgi:hypothetical protein